MWWHQEGLKDEEAPASLAPRAYNRRASRTATWDVQRAAPSPLPAVPISSGTSFLQIFLLPLPVSPLTHSASKREGREIATLKEEEGLEDGRDRSFLPNLLFLSPSCHLKGNCTAPCAKARNSGVIPILPLTVKIKMASTVYRYIQNLTICIGTTLSRSPLSIF